MHGALQHVAPFQWTPAKTRAAALVSAGGLSGGTVAGHVGVSRRTLYTWRRHPDFAARVRELVQEVAGRRVADSVATLNRCLADLDRRWQQLGQTFDRITRERAADPSMRGVPGGSTGLVVRKVKVIGTGKNRRTVTEYRLDRGLLAITKEMRQLEKLAALLVGPLGG